MLIVPASVKVHLALGYTDMRNYVERRIMRSPDRIERDLDWSLRAQHSA